MKFGQRMKVARLARCIDQKKLAEMAQIPQSSISYIESGKYTPGVEKNKEALATSLVVSAYWLDTGRSSPFEGISHPVQLNACRLRNSENAAIDLLRMQASNEPLFARYYIRENCFIIRCDSNFAIFFLCKDRKTQEVKRQLANIFFLHDIIDEINLKDNPTLASCFRGVLLPEKLQIHAFHDCDDAGVPWWSTNYGTLAQSTIEELLGINEGELEQWWQERNPDESLVRKRASRDTQFLREWHNMQSDEVDDVLDEIIKLLRKESEDYKNNLLETLRSRHRDPF